MRKGWENKKLGEVCTLISDGSHNPPKGIDHSLYRMISSQNVFDDNLQITEDNVRYITESDHLCENKRTKLQKDVVLLTIVGTIGRSCVLKGDEGCLTLQRSVAALHPSDQIMPRYLMHCLIGNRHTLNQEAHGIAQKGIYLKQLSSLSIPLPPKSTQLAIVTELDKINELIRLKKEQLKDFDNLAQSLFYEMFGDPVENEKGWEVHLLKTLCTKIGSGATPKGGSKSYKKEGTSLIRSLNIHNNEFKFKDLAYIDDDQADSLNNVIVQENDVLLNITGASVARCCIVPTEVLPARVNQHVCILRHGNLIDAKYLNRLLTNGNYQQLLQRLAKSKAATREALPKSIVDKLSIPLPPLSLQRLFAQRIEQIEREKSEVQKSIQDLETLLASRMQYWFE